MATKKVADSKFGLRMKQERMHKNLSIEDLAAKCETGYENIRKIEKGASPSLHILARICEVLGLPLRAMEKLVIEDKARAKGTLELLREASGVDPRIEPFLVYLPYLTASDLDELAMMFKMRAERNQQNNRPKVVRRGA